MGMTEMIAITFKYMKENTMKRDRNVKIVATLGPAPNDYDMIRKLFEAGADVLFKYVPRDHSEIKAAMALSAKLKKI